MPVRASLCANRATRRRDNSSVTELSTTSVRWSPRSGRRFGLTCPSLTCKNADGHYAEASVALSMIDRPGERDPHDSSAATDGRAALSLPDEGANVSMSRTIAKLRPERPAYLSLQSAAHLHDVSVKTIRRRIADGTLPGYRVGGQSASPRIRSRPASRPSAGGDRPVSVAYKGQQLHPDDWSAGGMDADLHADLCDMLRIVMRESARGVDERLRLAGALLDLADRAGLTSDEEDVLARFDVLTAQRTMRDDDDLSGSQLGLLLCATLRADSKGAEPGRVRASLALLANDAKVNERTARRAFQAPAVLRYFARVERKTRRVGLWFHPTVTGMVSAVDPVGAVTSGLDFGRGVRSEAATADPVSATPDAVSGHLPVCTPTAEQAATN